VRVVRIKKMMRALLLAALMVASDAFMPALVPGCWILVLFLSALV
jgi:hypothetical protein